MEIISKKETKEGWIRTKSKSKNCLHDLIEKTCSCKYCEIVPFDDEEEIFREVSFCKYHQIQFNEKYQDDEDDYCRDEEEEIYFFFSNEPLPCFVTKKDNSSQTE